MITRPQPPANGSPQISEHLKDVLWIYAARGEINPADVPLLEAEHRHNLQTHGSYVLSDAEMRMLSSELGIHHGGRSSYAESLAHVLDCIHDTEGDHLDAIREVMDREPPSGNT